MEETDIVNHAIQLKHLLLQHDKAVSQIAMLEMQILDLDTKIFTHNLNGNTLMKINLERRKSTIMGVKIMFTKYKQQKWETIQKLSAHILQTLQPEHSPPTEPWQTDLVFENDSMVAIATDMFCSQYRSK